MGSSIRYPVSYPPFQYMKVVGSLICMAKIPSTAHSTAHLAALFLYLEVVGCPLSCPLSFSLFQYMELVGNLICIAKSNGQRTTSPTCSTWAAKWAAPLFFPYGNVYDACTLQYLIDNHSPPMGTSMMHAHYSISSRITPHRLERSNS